MLRRRTRTSEAVSPSKFAFQSLDEGASISYSQSSNESVKVQRSSNAFSFPTYTLTCQERSVEVVPAIKRIHSHTKAVFLSSNEGFERIRYQADTIQQFPRALSTQRSEAPKPPFGLSFGFPPCDVLPISVLRGLSC